LSRAVTRERVSPSENRFRFNESGQNKGYGAAIAEGGALRFH
jgi:hypothetical protein